MNPLPPVTPAQYATIILPVVSFAIGLLILGTWLWKHWKKNKPLVVKEPLQVTTRKRKEYATRDELSVVDIRLTTEIQRLHNIRSTERKEAQAAAESRDEKLLAALAEMRRESREDMQHVFTRMNNTDTALARLEGKFSVIEK